MYKTLETELRTIQLPVQTDTYKPVSHSQLIDLVQESCLKAGFDVRKAEYSSAKEGKVANAKYLISNVADNEMQLQIGWQNSYDKSLSLKYAIGAQIFICKNGLVKGDMGALKRKHTGDVQEFTPYTIVESIKKAGDVFKKIQEERELLKSVEIDKRTCAELIGRMIVEENFIQSSQLNIIRKEMRHPSFNYGSENSLWELYQHTTFSMKETHPALWMKNHIAAHNFFVNFHGELVTAPASKVWLDASEVINENPEIETYGVDPVRQLSIFGNGID